jgi:hypothetical protein
MLCDAVIHSKRMPVEFHGFEPMRQKIIRAQKFVLAPDFAAAAEGLVDNYVELERVLPFCRLPYPLCWFEFAQGDRPEFFNAPLGIGCKRVSRVGFLCEQRDRASLWVQHMFWTFLTEPGENSSVGACLFDTEKDEAQKEGKRRDFQGEVSAKGPASEAISRAICPIPPEIASRMLSLIAEEDQSRVIRHMLMEDWRGEVRFTVAMLGLLNARNVSETETVDKTEHNRKRAKKAQPPLCSHTLLKIRPKLKPMLVHGRNWQQRQMDVRAHFVRGHFKQRATGVFWWSTHMRGSEDRGFVTKDYEIGA